MHKKPGKFGTNVKYENRGHIFEYASSIMLHFKSFCVLILQLKMNIRANISRIVFRPYKSISQKFWKNTVLIYLKKIYFAQINMNMTYKRICNS